MTHAAPALSSFGPRAALIRSLDADRPVLIAGPTASGKSALALDIASAQGGVIVNADALQVYANWRVLTARPSDADMDAADHRLYGHVPAARSHSTGDWLRSVAPILSGPARPIIVGGSGLLFAALTDGLSDIPPIPAMLRRRADDLRRTDPGAMLAELDRDDPETAGRIDRQNPMRIQRAWEVLKATGVGFAEWHRRTPPPLLPLAQAQPILLAADRDWLSDRIDRRFDLMMQAGALDEARTNLADWDPARPSARAIGGPELISHLQGQLSLAEAVDLAKTASKQYAKRQRTWFRARMGAWRALELP